MKLISGIALSVALLAGCAEKNEEAVELEVAVQSAAPAPMVVEYIYCNAGADYSPENFAKLTAAWNEINDADPTPAAAAFGIVPKVANENYDGMWANIWSSAEAREAGWKDWVENQAAAFGEKFDSTTVCHPDKRFLFELSPVTAPMQEWDPAEVFQATYRFCAIKEGKTQTDTLAASVAFASWIDGQRTAGRGTNYMSFLHVPTFDPATAGGTLQNYDFVRADFWGSASEQAADEAAWNAEGNIARELSDTIFDCQDASFDLYSIKRMASQSLVWRKKAASAAVFLLTKI